MHALVRRLHQGDAIIHQRRAPQPQITPAQAHAAVLTSTNNFNSTHQTSIVSKTRFSTTLLATPTFASSVNRRTHMHPGVINDVTAFNTHATRLVTLVYWRRPSWRPLQRDPWRHRQTRHCTRHPARCCGPLQAHREPPETLS